MGEEFFLWEKLFNDGENFPKNFQETVKEIQRVAESIDKNNELSKRVKEKLESPARNNFPKKSQNVTVRAASFDKWISIIITAPNGFHEYKIELDRGIR